ncbi:MAG: delta-60 repeat domain-containing protein, partial [Flavobacteriales bacterium]
MILVLRAVAQITALDPTFNPSDQGMARYDGLYRHGYAPGDGVQCMAVQADGKLIVAGIFTGGVLEINDPIFKPGIARLNADGSHDAGFSAGTGLNGSVTCIVQQPDGKLLVGGSFTAYNGNPSKGIVRLNTDGSFDPSFAVGSGSAGVVLEIAVQPDGKVLLGGTFTSFNGAPAARIVRLTNTGAVDFSFSTGAGFDGEVRAIALQADGQVLVGGAFTHYQGTQRNYLARLSTTGILDPFYNDNTILPGPGGPLIDIAIGNASSAFISFDSNEFNGGAVGNNPIKLDVNGARIVTFLVSGQVGPSKLHYNAMSNTLTCLGEWGIAHTANGNTGAGGFGYGTYRDDWYYRINCAMLIVDWRSGAVGPNGEVYRLDPEHMGILRLNNDLTLDHEFHPGSGLGYFNPTNLSMTVDGSGRIVVAGRLDNHSTLPACNGNFAPNAYRLWNDGTFDDTFDMPYGFEGNITHVAWMGEDRYAFARPIGSFVCAPGSLATSGSGALINLYDAQSGTMTGLSPDGCSFLDAEMGDMVRLNSGALLYAGNVDCLGSGLDVGRFTVGGSWDASYATTDLNSMPRCIAEAPDGKVYVGGAFTMANGITRNRIVRLLANGGVDPGFDPLSGFNGTVQD